MNDIKEKAIKAFREDEVIREKKRAERVCKISFEALAQLKDTFPSLYYDPKNVCLKLAGHDFKAIATGYRTSDGTTVYSLSPSMRPGLWVWSMATLGEYLLWYDQLLEGENKATPKLKNKILKFLKKPLL